MGAAGSCRICARPDVGTIDDRLLSHASFKGLSRDFGLPRSTIQVHWDRCRRKGAGMVPVPAPVIRRDEPVPDLSVVAMDAPPPEVLRIPRSETIPEDESIGKSLQELRAVHGVALKEYSSAYKTKDSRLMAILLPQLRANIELRERLIAKTAIRKSAAERLMSNPEFAAASRVLFGVLDRHPEAKADVIEALEAWIGGEA